MVKVLLAMWEICLHESNCNYNSYKFGYTFAFIPFLSFLRNQKQESDFQQVGVLVAIKIPAFCFKASHILLQSHAKFNRLL